MVVVVSGCVKVRRLQRDRRDSGAMLSTFFWLVEKFREKIEKKKNSPGLETHRVSSPCPHLTCTRVPQVTMTLAGSKKEKNTQPSTAQQLHCRDVCGHCPLSHIEAVGVRSDGVRLKGMKFNFNLRNKQSHMIRSLKQTSNIFHFLQG